MSVKRIRAQRAADSTMGAVKKIVQVNTRLPKLIRTAHLHSEYNAKERSVWMHMKAPHRPCFTPESLRDILAQEDAIMCAPEHVNFLVFASAVSGVFNLGGDLDLFRTLAASKDEAALMSYAENCVSAVHNALVGLNAGIITIALIEGDALGGGLEAALACHIVVAERGARMGFPEINFNLFPGMGAYSLLARKVGPRIAEDLITHGHVLTSEQMRLLGVVDHLAEKGEGKAVVRDIISDKAGRLNGYRAFQKAKLQSYLNVPLQELLDMTKEWVRAAFQLSPRDLKLMERLVRAQDRIAANLRY